MDSVFIVCKITGDWLAQSFDPLYVFDNEEAAASCILWLEKNSSDFLWDDDVSFGHWELPLRREFNIQENEDEAAFFDMEDN